MMAGKSGAGVRIWVREPEQPLKPITLRIRKIIREIGRTVPGGGRRIEDRQACPA
jgi:hypothetical protein